MRKCSRENCESNAEFECFCNNERKIFCRNDNKKHIAEIKTVHSNKPLDMKEQNKIQKKLIRTLKSQLQIVSHNKKIIFELMLNLISQLEECVNEKVRELSEIEKQLQKAISDINYVDKMQSCNLKSVFKMTYKNFKAECKNWDLIKVSLNTFDAQNSIKKLIEIKSQVDKLYTNEKIIPFSSEPQPIIKPADQPAIKPADQPAIKPADQPAIIPLNQPAQRIEANNLPTVRQNKIICRNTHELKWLLTAPFQNLKKTESIWIYCECCKAKFSTACWNCITCNYNICEKCGENVGIFSPKLKCSENHELFWRPDADLYYELKGGLHGFRCNTCNSIKDEAHWHCRECDFDICISCGKEKKQIPFTCPPKCLKNHKLMMKDSNLSKPIEMSLSCCKCKSDISKCDYYACEACLYFLCTKCYDYINYSISGHPIMFCQSEHPPHWVQKSKFECDYCFKNLNQEHFNCSFCKYDICFECSNILLNYAIKGDTIKHGQNGHPLEWLSNTIERNNGDPIRCVKCNEGYLGAGMFYCEICRLNICLLCAFDPDDRRLKINQQNNYLQDGQVLLQQFQLLNEKLLKKFG
ncbi:hypothetical protein SteCoe_36254 [Stentor coeruleus]|uniref:KKT2/KKT3 zinc finger domain-containing protein n=1 Tax=Stentor coeruleus TaxID=5963 RepID=A0A1R2AQI7_9CILI|nr:hypothetical protein SteCoe_36254 [Stentor coeruleus]